MIRNTLPVSLLFSVLLFCTSFSYSQTVTDVKGDIEDGDLKFEDLGEDGFSVLSLINNNTGTYGSKERQFVHYDCDMQVVRKVSFEHNRTQFYSNSVFEPSSKTTYIVETSVGSTNFAKKSYSVTRINSQGIAETKEFREFKDLEGKRAATMATTNGLFFLWVRPLSDEEEDKFELDWKAQPKKSKGPKIHKIGSRLTLYSINFESGSSKEISLDLGPISGVNIELPYWQYLNHTQSSIKLFTHKLTRAKEVKNDIYTFEIAEIGFDGKLVSRNATNIELEGYGLTECTPWKQQGINSSQLRQNVYSAQPEEMALKLNLSVRSSISVDKKNNVYVTMLGQSRNKYLTNDIWSPQKLYLHKFDSKLNSLWSVEQALSSKLKSIIGSKAQDGTMRNRVLIQGEAVIAQIMGDIGLVTYEFESKTGDMTSEKFLKLSKRPFEITTSPELSSEKYVVQLFFDLGLSQFRDIDFLKAYNKLSSGSSSSSTAAIKLKNPTFFISECPNYFALYNYDSDGDNTITKFELD